MNIPIQNIYFLLCYAWDKLDESDIIDVKAISTTKLIELFTSVLINGTNYLLKKGLERYYTEDEYIVNGIKGKLNLSASIKSNSIKEKTICLYDELDYNILHNRILKTTIRNLLRINNLDNKLKDELHRIFIKLPPIKEIKIRSFHFKEIRLHRNNRYYDFILKVCHIIHENLFINESSGDYKFQDFIREEKSMARLFESFVRNFYKREQLDYKVSGEIIKWKLMAENKSHMDMLPLMRTDISLKSPLKKIIIDTKFYKEAFHKSFSNEKINSGHLYQLFSYLKNQEDNSEITRNCEGILLYPSVGYDFRYSYQYETHKIRILSINLNQEWYEIKRELLAII
jgi:5-methylcytosine-specific restriction enzyme subunit McrC